MDNEEGKEAPKTVYLCSTDYSKAFDTVQHLKMWNDMKSIGILEHLTTLIRDLYTHSKKPKCTLNKAQQKVPKPKTSKANCILSPGRV